MAHSAALQTSEPAEGQDGGKDVDRIAAFSDAIYAFSMTVLATEIKVPIVTGDLASALPPAMIDQLPHFLSFIVAFLVVALYWTGHHRMFRHIRRVDSRLIWLNIFMLMFVAFMPVASGYMGEYGEIGLIAALDACVLIAISVFSALLWRHAATAGLLDKTVTPRLVRLFQWRVIVLAIVFGLSIPIALTLGAIPAELSWILIWPAMVLVGRRYRDVTPLIYGQA
jgi:uncharacterized membrane protein